MHIRQQEATRTAVYIQNRCPHVILKDKTPKEVFTGEKPKVGHLRIFGCSIYIHVPKEKRTKMEPSGNKRIFVGYSETSKAYKIFIPSTRLIEVNKDVTFHEEETFRRSRELQDDSELEKPKAPAAENLVPESSSPAIQREEEHDETIDPLEPTEIMERSLDEPHAKRRPTWFKETLQEAEKHATPSGTFKESRRPQRYVGYVALVSKISDAEPTLFEEVVKQQV